MKQVNLNERDYETIKDLIKDWGFEYSLEANRNDIINLARKIGIDEEYIKEHLEI